MDFFAHQEKARKRTALLVGLYGIAVALIIVAIYAVFAAAFGFGNAKAGHEVTLADFFDPKLFTMIAGGTLLVVAGASVFKISQLAAGGETVATMLGGELINSNTQDPDERKILNVVEEMAIASGIAVPRVFVLNEESGINAFAAGYSTRDVVIGVTRGCVKQLTRDELQGVVAHEFSHILNGDMRMNIRLMGVLFGILVLTVIGRILLRTRGKKNPLPLVGLALVIIGYIGVFFGNLIKSALSRQREFLADASAVQFTRNPSGIAGALKKIGGFPAGTQLSAANAEQASHMFFANGLTSAWISLFATHPPLVERIKRIDPSFDGNFESPTPQSQHAAPPLPVAGLSGGEAGIKISPADVMASVGTPQAEHLTFASGLVAALPAGITAVVSEPFGASAVIYGLLMDGDSQTREAQFTVVEKHVGKAICEETRKLLPDVKSVAPEYRLPLAELAVSALKGLSVDQYDAFCDTTVHLIEADSQVDLFEYALQRMIVRRLEPVFRKVRPPAPKYHDITPLLPYCSKLLSCLAYWGADDQATAEKAFLAAAGKIGARLSMKLVGPNECGLKAVDESLDVLELAAPAIRKNILSACVICIGSDGRVTVEEAELLRVIADALNCPIPPMISQS